ncbi:MAG: hypothetical protein ACXWO1_14960, partial [Isosphaeraceae bacterium]
ALAREDSDIGRASAQSAAREIFALCFLSGDSIGEAVMVRIRCQEPTSGTLVEKNRFRFLAPFRFGTKEAFCSG